MIAEMELPTMRIDLQKLLRVINSCETVAHLDASERMLNNFVRKWKLSTETVSNPVCDALYNHIMTVRNTHAYNDATTANLLTDAIEIQLSPENEEWIMSDANWIAKLQ